MFGVGFVKCCFGIYIIRVVRTTLTLFNVTHESRNASMRKTFFLLSFHRASVTIKSYMVQKQPI